MIKKIEMPEMDETYKSAMFAKILGNKINELVDAVNGILDYAPLEMAMKAEPKPADPYAEQRKWIGKLCKFRDTPVCEWEYGVLEKFYEDTAYPFLDTDGYEYVECEPVKPDDDIIYKGE